MVTVRGEIIVNDLDEGWLRICPDPSVSDRRWAVAIKAAVKNLQSKLDSTLAIYYRFLETTDPAIPQALERHVRTHVKASSVFPHPEAIVDVRKHYLDLNSKCIECGMAVISADHAPYCGPACEDIRLKDGTKVNWPLPPEILELRKKIQEEKEAAAKAKAEESDEEVTKPMGPKPTTH